jgi:hypothetical protein
MNGKKRKGKGRECMVRKGKEWNGRNGRKGKGRECMERKGKEWEWEGESWKGGKSETVFTVCAHVHPFHKHTFR